MMVPAYVVWNQYSIDFLTPLGFMVMTKDGTFILYVYCSFLNLKRILGKN